MPEPLRPLARRQAAEVRHAHFGTDAETLVARMREAIAADLASERVEAETKWKMEEEQRQANVRREALEALEERLEAERRAEEEQKQAEAKARQQAEEEARLLEAEAKRRAEEERKQAEAVAARQEAEEKARRLEAEAKRKVKEEQKLDMATVGRTNVDRRALALAAAVVLLLIGAGGYTVVQQMNRSSADLLSATTEAEAVEARKMAALFTSKEAMEGVWVSGRIGKVLHGLQFRSDCQKMCAQDVDCDVYSWRISSQVCYLYNATAELKPNKDFVSGVRK